MKSEEFKVLQNPLKEKYRSDPATARVTLRASGRLGEGATGQLANLGVRAWRV